jgi:phosphoribosylformimino-5-aminoimidazole carboxamide ribotide isomerase
MQIIPAIDIRAGKCVRLLQGRAEQQTIYGHDPVVMAQRWVEAGAPMLHVVDLDGAFAGQLQNLAVIERLVRAVPVPVQVGGGIRDLRTLVAVLASGVSRVVLGTVALERWELLAAATERFPGQICVGIDSQHEQVAVHGWQTVSTVATLAFAQQVSTTKVAAIIYTDITRDGTLQGPNIAGIAAVAQSVTVPVIASGGVATLADLQRLAALQSMGVTGVIVGKALYEGRFDYQQACAVGQE